MSGVKIFIGPKLRELRSNRGLTQTEMARALGVSTSYVNLIERNQRSASLKFLVTLSDTFGLNWRQLTNSGTGLQLSDLRQITRDPAFGSQVPDIEELRACLEHSPNLANGLVNIFNAYRAYGERLAEQSEALSTRGGDRLNIEQGVHDFFRNNNNHFAALEERAERSCVQNIGDRQELYSALKAHLKDDLGVAVEQVRDEDMGSSLRFFDREKKLILLSDGLDHSNMVFQLAHMTALIEFPDLINEQMPDALRADERGASRCRVELANYFAAAVMMPYADFYDEARKCRYDIDRLATRFSVSYEQVCHRLTTLQRPGQRAIPFFFLRIDRGGNVSKRFNATPIQLARYGGACPRLDVHYCFRVAGRILTQIVEMPDNSRYMTVNRTVDRPSIRYSNEDNRLAVSIGCPVEYASEMVYADHLDLNSTRMITEIGINCRLCPRQHCAQRAHDPFFSSLQLDENRRGATHFES